MNAIITGGSGLVGSHIIESLLRSGVRPLAISRSDRSSALVETLGAEPIQGDVTEPETWNRLPPADVIIHAAAQLPYPGDWAQFERTNVLATRSAVNAASNRGARLINISSVAVYGRVPQRPIREDAIGEIPGWDYYARSKRLAEVETEPLVTRGQAVNIRPCVVYGPRDRLFLPKVIGALRWGIVPQIGDGSNHLAIVSAANVAESCRCVLETENFAGSVNAATDGPAALAQRQFFDILEETVRPLRRVRIPPGMANLLSRSLSWITAMRRNYKGPSLDALSFLGKENPFDHTILTESLGWHPAGNPAQLLRAAALDTIGAASDGLS